MIKLSPSSLDAMRKDVSARHDREQAKALRTEYPSETVAQSEADLVLAVRDARIMANHFEVTNAELKNRFVALGAVTAPRFWEDENLKILLNASTGTGDIRFSDASIMLKHAAYHSDQAAKVWW